MKDLRQNNALGLAVAGLRYEAGTPHQKLQMRLDIFGESIVLTRYNDGSPCATFEVAPESLASAFSGIQMATGILPENCIYYSREPEEKLAIYIPPHRRKLTVTGWSATAVDTDFFYIPLPPLVFCGQGVSYSVWAAKGRPNTGYDQLYKAPFPNVYSDGRICPGNVSFPACSSDTIHQAASLFLESNFNQDLSTRKSRSADGSVIGLWNELDGEEEYPIDDLVYDDQIRRRLRIEQR